MRTIRAMVKTLGPAMALDVFVPILTFVVASALGASEVTAYLLASIGPGVSVVHGLVSRRRIDLISVVFLVLMLGSGVVALLDSTNATLLLLKDSAFTAAFGLACLVSVLPIASRPMMYWLGLKYGTSNTVEAESRWAESWGDDNFRDALRLATIVWGVGFLIEAALKVYSSVSLPFDAAVIVNNIAPVAIGGVLLLWTIRYAKRNGVHLEFLGPAPEPVPVRVSARS